VFVGLDAAASCKEQDRHRPIVIVWEYYSYDDKTLKGKVARKLVCPNCEQYQTVAVPNEDEF
jgi:hypothetical protein